MKKALFLYIALLVVSCGAFAQPHKTIYYSGIYKTAQDFKDERLSYMINCDSSSGKIKFHHFFSGKYVDVIQAGKKHRLSKDSIFGYRNCKGKDYRFYGDNSNDYQVEEVKGVIIYSALVNDPAYTGKGIKLVTAYFFSKTFNTNILPLTVANLKQAFPGDIRFSNMSDKDISAYDDIHKMYKINYLLMQSTNILQ
ncbi:MAG TPA: hypothetical protein VN922_04590 [Bacteroidia bacterium]|nr:hypothetical protein [Bacteroidia bacterium]